MEDTKENSPEANEVAYDYIKSNYFRVIHADGIFGGFNARGLLNIDIWSERPAIPQHAEYQIVDGKRIGDEIMDRRVGRSSSIREVEVAVMMDLPLAKSFLKWLQARVEQLEAIASGESPKE